MRKLDDTASNLVRINDIKSEIESRIEPLKEAAATTEKYLEFADKLRKVQVTQFVHRIENIEVVKNKLAVKFEELEAKSNEMSTNVSVKEADGMKLYWFWMPLQDRMLFLRLEYFWKQQMSQALY